MLRSPAPSSDPGNLVQQRLRFLSNHYASNLLAY